MWGLGTFAGVGSLVVDVVALIGVPLAAGCDRPLPENRGPTRAGSLYWWWEAVSGGGATAAEVDDDLLAAAAYEDFAGG